MVTEPSLFAPSKVIAPPVNSAVPVAISMAPVWVIALLPASKIRLPDIRVIAAISIASFSVRLTLPAPELTVTVPRILAPSKVMAPPVRLAVPVAISMAPVWVIALLPASKFRLPDVRVIAAISISSFSVMERSPDPLFTVIVPSTFAESDKMISPPVRETALLAVIAPTCEISSVPASRIRFPLAEEVSITMSDDSSISTIRPSNATLPKLAVVESPRAIRLSVESKVAFPPTEILPESEMVPVEFTVKASATEMVPRSISSTSVTEAPAVPVVVRLTAPVKSFDSLVSSMALDPEVKLAVESASMAPLCSIFPEVVTSRLPVAEIELMFTPSPS